MSVCLASSPWKASLSIRDSSFSMGRIFRYFSITAKIGASGEIRTLKHLLLRQALFQFAHAGTWCTGEDLNLRVPLGETGLQPVRFGRAHAPVQTWRKVDESNAHRSSRCPGFQDQLPAIQQYLPLAESTGVEPVSLLREPLLSRQVPYRP